METLVAWSQFSTFYTAVSVAGLADALNSTGPFTVFVPNNEAFDKIPSKILSSYGNPKSIGQFKDMVSRHIVPNVTLGKDEYYSLCGEVEQTNYGIELETIGGATILAVKGDAIWPHNTRIQSLVGKAYVTTDWSKWCVRNGCIYLIDNVV